MSDGNISDGNIKIRKFLVEMRYRQEACTWKDLTQSELENVGGVWGGGALYLTPGSST